MKKRTLRGARADKGYTQAQAAKLIGVGLSTLQKWENGASYPKQPQIDIICKIYEVNYNDLDFAPNKKIFLA